MILMSVSDGFGGRGPLDRYGEAHVRATHLLTSQELLVESPDVSVGVHDASLPPLETPPSVAMVRILDFVVALSFGDSAFRLAAGWWRAEPRPLHL
jgi:hypothetical protein